MTFSGGFGELHAGIPCTEASADVTPGKPQNSKKSERKSLSVNSPAVILSNVSSVS